MHALTAALVLVIRIYNVYGSPPHDVLRAQRVAAEMRETSGIEVLWLPCAAEAAAAACAAVLGPGEVVVRITAAPGVPTDGHALGSAYVDASVQRGVLATLYG